MMTMPAWKQDSRDKKKRNSSLEFRKNHFTQKKAVGVIASFITEQTGGQKISASLAGNYIGLGI